MQCLILAGGLGTRMRPLTENFPKALLPVKGQPFAFHQLALLAESGITDVVYSIGFQGAKIRETVGDGGDFGLKVRYVDEGENLLGTGGAIRLALEEGVLENTFFVLYGDSYLPTGYRQLWEDFFPRPEPAMMAVFRNQGKFDKSNVLFDNGKVKLYDKKPQKPGAPAFDYIDYGLSLLRKSTVTDLIPSQTHFDLADLFHMLSIQGKLAGFEVRDRFYEAGSPQGIRDLETFLKTLEKTTFH